MAVILKSYKIDLNRIPSGCNCWMNKSQLWYVILLEQAEELCPAAAFRPELAREMQTAGKTGYIVVVNTKWKSLLEFLNMNYSLFFWKLNTNGFIKSFETAFKFH